MVFYGNRFTELQCCVLPLMQGIALGVLCQPVPAQTVVDVERLVPNVRGVPDFLRLDSAVLSTLARAQTLRQSLPPGAVHQVASPFRCFGEAFQESAEFGEPDRFFQDRRGTGLPG